MFQPLLLSTWSFGQRSNVPGWEILARGGSALDAVEAVGRFAEDDLTNPTVGTGGYPDASGQVSLDASIMLSPSKRGAVANIRKFANPISIARKVMEITPHAMLAGAEADAFAAANGFVPRELLTENARAAWEMWKKKSASHPQRPIRNIEEMGFGSHDLPSDSHDTIGVLALDQSGTLAGACTTSGLAFKLPGRVGDSPIIGHGLYVDPHVGAAVATGHGELVMGICGAFLAVETLRRGGSPLEAAYEVIERMKSSYDLLDSDQIGLIVLRKDGAWDCASLHGGFQAAVRSADRDELVAPRVSERARKGE